jgi:hypothetical protein
MLCILLNLDTVTLPLFIFVYVSYVYICCVDVMLLSYFLTPASEPKLTNPSEVHEVIQGLNVGKTPDPNGILKTALEASSPAS